MKRLALLLIVWVVAATSAVADSQEDAFLSATRLRESNNHDWMTGRFGERGSYQFRRSTWRLHTRASFDLAFNREVANAVAHRHYQWIMQTLERNGVPATPYNMACAWNGGAGAVSRGTVSRAAREYGECVNNLTAELLRRQARVVQPKPFVVKLASLGADTPSVRVNLASRPPETPTFDLWQPDCETLTAFAQPPARQTRLAEVSLDTRPLAVDRPLIALIFFADKG